MNVEAGTSNSEETLLTEYSEATTVALMFSPLRVFV